MDEINPLFWQFVWFFSMDEGDQKLLIGPVDSQWFIEEDETNKGANYLIGICLAFFEISPPGGKRELESQIHALRHTVNRLSNDVIPSHWAFQTLAQTEDWKSARNIARALLRESKTLVRPPRKPFKIEDIIRVDHFAHASVARKHMKRSKKIGHRERGDDALVEDVCWRPQGPGCVGTGAD